MYLITNNVNDTVYVGATSKTLEFRFKTHKKAAKKDGSTSSCLLYRAMNKHGEENFQIHALLEVFSLEEAYELEKEEISKRKEAGIRLYNIRAGGSGGYPEKRKTRVKRAPCSEETRRKISAALIGRKTPEEQKRKISESSKGKPRPKTKPVSQETKDKVSASLKIRFQDPEEREKISRKSRGSGNGHAILTEEDVIFIRSEFKKSGYCLSTRDPEKTKFLQSLCEKFQILYPTIYWIIQGRLWKHLPI